MKNAKIIAAAALLSTLSFGAFAAELVNSDQTGQYQEIGTVSASGLSDVTTLQHQLEMKADKAGATAYTITNVTGDTALHGTATLYK